MKLPAFNLCLASLKTFTTNATLDRSLLICKIGGADCDIKHFYSYEIRTGSTIFTCYVLNGGKNFSGHLSEIKSVKNIGPSSGFEINFFLPKDHYFFYYINDAFVKPTTPEIIKPIFPGKIINY